VLILKGNHNYIGVMFGGFMKLDKKHINHTTPPVGQFDNVMIAVIWDVMSFGLVCRFSHFE